VLIRRILAFIAVVLGLELAAAAPVPNASDPVPAQTPLPKTVFQIDNDGTALHLESQLQCPATIGEFHRTRLDLFDPFGVDVGCDYQDVEHDEITLYIALRPGQELGKQFDSAKAALVQRLPAATPLADTEQQTSHRRSIGST
jgi:hypothetical protein